MSAAIAGKFGFTRTIDYQGTGRAGGLQAGGSWLHGLGTDRQDRLRRGLRAGRAPARLLLGLGGAALALGLGASNAIARRFARPIRRLARTSSAVAAGDLSVR